MIHGVGTDIVELARMSRAWQRHGDRLARRLLHPKEIAQLAQAGPAAQQHRFLAKRFAAKEAVAKALLTGIRPPVTFSAMCIAHSPLGAPQLEASPELAAWLEARALRVHLSIADEQSHVVAFAMAEVCVPPTPALHQP